MSYKTIIKELKDERKENVILTASQMFLEKSIDEIAMTDIAKECDMGVASLYRYFGTKKKIVIKSGELLWTDMARLFEGIFEGEYFESKTGIMQIRELMKIFLVLYSAHKPFIKFVHDFDLFILKEKVTKEELSSYEKSVLNFLPVFEKAYNKGVKDNTIKEGIDCRLLYFSVSHALTAMSQKFIMGDILSSDNEIDCEQQLIQIIDNAICYIEK